MKGSDQRRFTFHASRWVVLSVAAVVAAVGGVRVVPWAAAATSTGDRAIFEPLVPARILDTRQPPANPLGPNESRVLQVTGAGGVPADATAVVLNVTAVSPTDEGYLTVYPADAALPNVSNVNFFPGQIVPNSVQVKLGSLGTGAGRIRIYNLAGQTHVIVDVGGYFRGHDHDDRYYTKAQTQARLAANSLTCPTGSFLSTVAADGTPTCGVGAQGPPGPQGVQGPAGATGVVTTAMFSGKVDPIGYDFIDFVFAGPPAVVTTTAGQRLTASGSASLGLPPGSPATEAHTDLCYQSTAGGPMRSLTADGFLLNTIAGEKRTYSVSGSRVPGAGTWRVGFCVRMRFDGPAISNNDYATGWVMVTN